MGTWRQLAVCLELADGVDDVALLAPLVSVSSNADAIKRSKDQWIAWLKRWRTMVVGQGCTREESAKAMRLVSPKYVPREWMLKAAYDKAGGGDFTLVKELFELFKQPYAEQPSF